MVRAVRGFVVLGLVLAGCGLARRASVNAVDTQLRARGSHLERAEGRGPMKIGDYEIEALAVEQTEVDPEGALAIQDVPRPIIQHHLAMKLRGPSGGRWDVQCTQQRRQSQSADYAAIIQENRDDISVVCDLRTGPAHAWRFVTEADITHNFRGRLSSAGEEPHALDIEVLLYIQRWGWLRRHLPDPVAQVRRDERAVAAMLLGRPEEAWVSAELPAELAEPSIAAMLALHHLPLGLDG